MGSVAKNDIEEFMEQLADFAHNYVNDGAGRPDYELKWNNLLDSARLVSEQTGIPMPNL